MELLAGLLRAEDPDTGGAACAALSHCACRLARQQTPWWAAAADDLHGDVVSQRPQLLTAAAELLPHAGWVLPGAVALAGVARCEAEGAAALPVALSTLRPALPTALRAGMAAAAEDAEAAGSVGDGGVGVGFAASSALALLLALGRAPPDCQDVQQVLQAFKLISLAAAGDGMHQRCSTACRLTCQMPLNCS